MDPLTQAALGAAVGHAGFYRRLGMASVTVGALAGAFPDIDAIASAFADPFGRLETHRGVTHSLIVIPVVSVVFGWLYWRWQSWPSEPEDHRLSGAGPWIALVMAAMLSHPLLDLCTHFGTQLFAPLSRARFSLAAIPVVDPLYSFMLAAGLAAALFWRKRKLAYWLTTLALVLSTAYLALGARINVAAAASAAAQLRSSGIDNAEVHSFPTMLQLPYRRLVAITPAEIRVGYISMWHPCRVEWDVAPVSFDQDALALRVTPEGRIFTWFASDLLTTKITSDNGRRIVELGDLRYGFDRDATKGMWGIQGRFDNSGNLLARPERVNNRPDASWENIAQLWQSAFAGNCETSDVR